LLVLGVLVIAATVATGISRRALLASAEARDAVDRLQSRWWSISAERSVLPRGEDLLRLAEADRLQPVTEIATTLELDGAVFTLELSDDTTRVNPFVLVRQGETSTWDREVRSALPAALRPHLDEKRIVGRLLGDPRRALYRDIFRPEAGEVDGFDDLLTPHGNGAINLLRTDETSLRLALVPPLSRVEVQDLLRARRDAFETIDEVGRERTLLQMLREAGVSINAGGDVQLWTAESTRHRLKSVWSNGRRTTTRTRVVDTDKDRPLDLVRVYRSGELP
ncbi:MAG: hypothetical protein AAGK78_15015, partial [Planctomycetota bacterium]